MTRNADAIAHDIQAAVAEHRAAYPHGDWKAANDKLSRLWHEAFSILVAHGFDPWDGGNEARVRNLRKIAAGEAPKRGTAAT